MDTASILASLCNLHVVMMKTRFPENIGMVARACANMGAGAITLVAPERWDITKAIPLGTPKGEPILHAVTCTNTLAEALAPYSLVVGTTARTGGWRQELLSPTQAAQEMIACLRDNAKVALLMGPEDRGLNNEEIEYCQRLVCIPTMPQAASLNVAQATLILLYECHTAMRQTTSANKHASVSQRITSADQERLYAQLKQTLLAIDFLHGDNPDYFLMPLRRFLGRSNLKRHEYDALMGICRQVNNKIHR